MTLDDLRNMPTPEDVRVNTDHPVFQFQVIIADELDRLAEDGDPSVTA